MITAWRRSLWGSRGSGLAVTARFVTWRVVPTKIMIRGWLVNGAVHRRRGALVEQRRAVTALLDGSPSPGEDGQVATFRN